MYTVFLPRDASAACHAVSVCVSACLSGYLSSLLILSKRINISSKLFHNRIATVPHHSSYSVPNVTVIFWRGPLPPPNGGVECRWSRQKSRFWANIWFHRVLQTVRPSSAINSTATDHGELITLVAGRWRSLLNLMAGDDDEVYDKIKVTLKDNGAPFRLIVCCGKSQA